MRHAALLAMLLAGCATAPRPPPPPTLAPGTLVHPSTIRPDFLVRQTVMATHADGEISFEAVLQKQGPKLTLLGLAPWGGKAFSLEQHGDEITFRKYVAHDLPFDPKLILLDINRAYFMGLPNAPLGDGEHEGAVRDERVHETWAARRLVARRITAGEGGAVVVRYRDWGDAPLFPKRVDLENPRYGYRLSIETTSFQALD